MNTAPTTREGYLGDEREIEAAIDEIEATCRTLRRRLWHRTNQYRREDLLLTACELLDHVKTLGETIYAAKL